MADFLIIAFALVVPLAVLFIYLYASTENLRKPDAPMGMEDIVPFLLPVKIEALEHLTDHLEEEYLHWRYTKTKFRSVQQRRVRESIEYLWRMDRNAKILQQLGSSHLHTGNPLMEALGNGLITAGVNLRLYVFLGLARLYFWKAVGLRPWPFVSVPRLTNLANLLNSDLIPAYECLKEKANNWHC